MERPETIKVGQVTSVPDASGWQTTYSMGVQGDELVVTGLTIVAHTGTPRGGLTAETARSLIKPGTAKREFVKAVAEGAVHWPMKVSEVDALMRAHAEGRAWRPEPTAEFVDFAAWLRNALPVFKRLVRGPQLNRRERIAQTAALYVEATTEGRLAPRKRVAEIQRRSGSAVRDDLYAARHESPPLLTDSGMRGRAGGVLTPAAMEILKEMQQ